MNVLSLFDGMSCGQIALNDLGIKYENYFASEIDKDAIKVTMSNFPNTIQIGDVRTLQRPAGLNIDLLIGGSPCQSFSFAGRRNGMTTMDNIEILTLDQYLELKQQGFEFKGQSYLFWEYVRMLKEFNPKYFLLENVVMSKKWEKIISDTLGVEPVFIDSRNFTAASRKRLYWTNINFDKTTLEHDRGLQLGNVVTCDDIDFAATASIDWKKLKSQIELTFYNQFLLPYIDKSEIWTERFFKKEIGTMAHSKAVSQLKTCYDKANCLTTSGQNLSNSGSTNIVYINKSGELVIRPLNPTEAEKLQGVPVGYTDCVSRNARLFMLGNGWTVDVIKHIFGGLQNG